MLPAMRSAIPLVVRNTFNPSFPGTKIGLRTMRTLPFKGISSIENIALVLLQGSGMRGTPGFAARLFGALAYHSINIILITQASSEYTICFAIDPKDTEVAKEAIEEEFKYEIKDKFIDPVFIEENLSIVAVIGERMINANGLSGKIFTTLGDSKVNIRAIALGSSERNISFVVSNDEEKKAIIALHKKFFKK
jgi:aspartokinase/homoserine dehydrogenase 1